MLLSSLKQVLQNAANTIAAKPFFAIGGELEFNHAVSAGAEFEGKLPLLWTMPPTTTSTTPNGQNKSIDTQNIIGLLYTATEIDLSLDEQFDNTDLADKIMRDFIGIIQTTEITRGTIKVNNTEISPLFRDTTFAMWGVGWIINITSPDDFNFCCDKV